MFPKTIHQIWLQGVDQIPVKFVPNMTKNKELNSGFKYVLWDEFKILELIRTLDKKYLNTYSKLLYLHQKVDFARYVILYVHGGIYMDMDAYCIKSFNDVLTDYQSYELIVSKTNTSFLENLLWVGSLTMINNGVIIAKSQSPTLSLLIDYITNLESDPKHILPKVWYINNTTGPKIFTRIVLESISLGNLIKILPYEYFEPCILSVCNITSRTVCIHKHEVSWFSPVLKCFCEWYVRHKMIVVIIFIIAVILVHRIC
jgi:mannosyltransferase OCH1-like enzyme